MASLFCRLSRLSFPLLVATAMSGCATVTMPLPAASAGNVEKLRMARLDPLSVDEFRLAPGRAPDMDSSLSGLRGSTIQPAGGSFSRQLRETIVAELKAAGLYDEKSPLLIGAQLTDSKVDAAIGTGTARLAARFTVDKVGKRVFDREISVDAQWESSFVGAIALPMAINQYTALYKTLAAKLFDDSDFRKAVTEK